MVYGGYDIRHDEDVDAPQCPICGDETVDYDPETDKASICFECWDKLTHDIGWGRNFLETLPEQEIGKTSWADFVLRECFGIEKCNNQDTLVGLLGAFESDTVLTDSDGTDFEVGEALAHYINEDRDARDGFEDFLREAKGV